MDPVEDIAPNYPQTAPIQQPTPPLDNKRKMAKLVTQFIILIVGVIATYFLMKFAFSSTGFDPSSIKRLDSTVVKMGDKIDSIEEYQRFLIERSYVQESRTIELQDDIAKIGNQVRKTNRDINELRKSYNEKISIIDGYSVAQIDSFFRARYGYYY